MKRQESTLTEQISELVILPVHSLANDMTDQWSPNRLKSQTVAEQDDLVYLIKLMIMHMYKLRHIIYNYIIIHTI